MKNMSAQEEIIILSDDEQEPENKNEKNKNTFDTKKRRDTKRRNVVDEVEKYQKGQSSEKIKRQTKRQMQPQQSEYKVLHSYYFHVKDQFYRLIIFQLN